MNTSTSRFRSGVPWVWAGSLAFAAVPLLIAGGVRGLLTPEVILQVLAALVYAALGLVIAIRQRGNAVAWLLLIVATGIVLNGASAVMLDGPADSGSVWRAFAIMWSNSGYFIAFIIPLLLLLYIFPTGHFLSRRWAWAGWAAAIITASVVFLEWFAAEVVLDGLGGATTTVSNPLGFHSLESEDGPFALLVGVPLLALIAGGPVAIVLRYRKASTMVRTQLKLALVAMAFIPLLLLTGTLLADSWVNTVMFLGATTAVPVAITVAIVRHSLFDIDVVISRSLTFGVLAAFIGVVYVAIVVGVGELLGGSGAPSFGLSLVATAVVALAFQPMRLRVERFANRFVYGKRETPYEVLSRFSRRAAEDSDVEVLARIPRLLVDGTGASEALLWVRTNDGFRTESVWPEKTTARSIEGAEFYDHDADLSVPVLHDGEVLGGMSLIAARGATITRPERELVKNLARGLGLAMRNGQLTAALRRQVKDLQRSRDRVVLAADDARRSLEHDLDSGPQQQLVAVKVKLGPLRKLAEQAGAERTARVLTDIESQAGNAIQALRDFAAGIYPPLLGAEGLGVALSQDAKRAALPVEIDADGVGRYPRDVESAVYFSILEALQNTAKYAEASRAWVQLGERNGDLWFEVHDNGRGFDTTRVSEGVGLNGIADRIDTIGGTWTITSTPGHGTVVTGSVPIHESSRV